MMASTPLSPVLSSFVTSSPFTAFSSHFSIVSSSSSYLFWYAFYALLFLLFYVFSSPFTSNRELRRHWSGYVYVSTILYVWLSVAVAFHLPILHYDTKVPISLFSPLLLASILTLFFCEGVVKLLNRWFVFHVGFRQNSLEILQNSILISVICCVVYTQCGTSSSSILERVFDSSSDQTLDLTVNAACAFFFSGHTNSHSKELPTVLVLWSTAISMLVINFSFERLAGFRGLFAEIPVRRALPLRAKSVLDERAVLAAFSATPNTKELISSGPSSSPFSPSSSSVHLPRLPESYFESLTSKMQDALLSPKMRDMISWYELTATSTAVDMLIHLKLFLGRFDMRTLQAALPTSSHRLFDSPVTSRSSTSSPAQPSRLMSLSEPNSHLDLASFSVSSSFLTAHHHPSHLEIPFYYDHLESSEELWFDWMSDCGDGFNPSYQVARMLAAPFLRVPVQRRAVKETSGTLQLPRARVLFLGGDLAYPSPTPETYENRFFNTFQCALPPPLGFDPAQIAVQKPAEELSTYRGPQCFALPGNHDWSVKLYFDCFGSISLFFLCLVELIVSSSLFAWFVITFFLSLSFFFFFFSYSLSLSF